MTAAPPASRRRRALRAVTAFLILAAILIGLPMLTIALGGLPHQLPTAHQVRDSLTRRDNGVGYFKVAAFTIIWLVWLYYLLATVRETAAAIRHRAPRPDPTAADEAARGLGLLSPRALVAAIVVLFIATPTVLGLHAAPASAAPTPTSPATPPPAATAPATPGPSHHPSPPPPGPAAPAASDPARLPRYTVHRYDTLLRIAAEHLPGDPTVRYREIKTLNPDRVGPDNEITTGTVLTLPADATGPGLLDPTHARTPTREVTVEVHDGDSLWSIEQRLTGDGANWPQAFAANAGRIEPDGDRFNDPNLIMPKWKLTIPIPGGTGQVEPAAPHDAPSHHPQPKATPATPGRPQADGPALPTQPQPGRGPTEPTSAALAPATLAPDRRADPAATRPSDRSEPATVLTFAGGGLLLAGVSLSALLHYRRRQSQRRTPGHVIAGSPPDLVPMERAVLAAGSEGVANVTWLDEALRSLVQAVIEQPGGRLPDVIAVRITDDELTLVLAKPAPSAPGPWQPDENATRWRIRRGDQLPYDAARRDAYFAPYPTLSSVGYTDTGEHWLLDLERMGAVSLCGDADRCLNLARFLAAELAHNSWSEMLQVMLVGFGAELVPANPDRLTYTDDLAAATSAVVDRLHSVSVAMRAVDTDVLDGRLHDIVGDQWAPTVLLIAPHLVAGTAGLEELFAAIRRQQARTAVALVLADDSDRAESTSWQLTIDGDGNLRVPALDLELIAQQIPVDEAAALAQMLAWATVCEEQPVPPAHGDDPWDRHADACGGLTAHAAEPETSPGDSQSGGKPPPADRQAGRQTAGKVMRVVEPAGSAPRTNSILPLPPQTYLDCGATTLKDLRVLAPTVDDRIRAEVEQSDPDLDQDYADWFDESCTRPKIRVLGPPLVRAQGSLPRDSPQVAFHTEALVLLTSRTNGLLSSEYAQLMWPNDPDVVGKPKVRQSVRNLRRWIGRDGETGHEYLPVWAFEGREVRYLVQKSIRDAGLFRRMRVRGVARGCDGLDDLWKALVLVAGPPFAEIPIRRHDEKGPGGWLWLTNANQRLDFEYQAMIVDTAHVVAQRHLGDGEPGLAARAARVALRVGSYDHVPLLDMVAACLALGEDAEAEAHVHQMMSNAGVEREEDLDPRTYEVLTRLFRRWRSSRTASGSR